MEFVDRVPPGERNLSVASYLELLYGCHDGEELKQVRQLVLDLFAEVIPLTGHYRISPGLDGKVHLISSTRRKRRAHRGDSA